MKLKDWYEAAVKSGIVYYTIHVSKSGCNAKLMLYTIHNNRLVKAWPDVEAGSGFTYDSDLAKKLNFKLDKVGGTEPHFLVKGYGFSRIDYVLDLIADTVCPEYKNAGNKQISCELLT